jgi:hypothetical protein
LSLSALTAKMTRPASNPTPTVIRCMCGPMR